MRKITLKIGWVAFCCLLCSNAFGKEFPINSINDLVTFCTDQNEYGISYPAGTDDEWAYEYGTGCLESTPAPQWFIMQIGDEGDLGIYISHSEEEDIDFACFGPFQGKNKTEIYNYISTHPEVLNLEYHGAKEIPEDIDCYENYPEYVRVRDSIQAIIDYKETYEYPNYWQSCYDSIASEHPNWSDVYIQWDADDCAYSKFTEAISQFKFPDNPVMYDVNNPCFRGLWDEFPFGNMIDCSYSTSSKEMCYIPNAKEGEWYILLITNYSQEPGTISFNKTYGEATTNCNIIVDAYTTGPYCEGETIQLGVNNAPDEATFSWVGPNGFSSRQRTITIPNGTVEHSGTYSVVMVANGKASPAVEVEVNVYAKKETETEESISAGDYYLFGDKKLYTAGEYTEVFKSTETGCDSIVHLTLKLNSVDPVIDYDGPTCEGETIVLNLLNAPSGATFSWEGPNGFSSIQKNISIPNATEKEAGEYTVVMTVNGAESSPVKRAVTVHPKKETSLNEEIDFGESYTFGEENLTQSGTYQKRFSSVPYGCDSIVTLSLSIRPLDPILISNNGPLCEGEALQLSLDGAPNNGSFQWSGPNGFSSTEQNPTISEVTANNRGEYTVEISVNNQKAGQFATTVVVNPISRRSIEAEIPEGENYIFGDEEFDEPGTYQLVFTGHNGCDSIISLTLRQGIRHYPELIPEEFISPNGDGCFDTWIIHNVEEHPNVTVFIFDRFGKLLRKIAHYDNQEAVWDGTDDNGKTLPSTDYWYLIYTSDADRVYKGHVSLVR